MSKKRDGLQYERVVLRMLERQSNLQHISQCMGSGTFWFDKEDLKADLGDFSYLIQVKGTTKPAYRINIKDVYQVWTNAFEANRIPLFCVLFADKFQYTLIRIHIKYMPKEDKKYNKSYNIKQADISEGHTEIIANEENQFELFFEEILYQSK